MRLVWHTRRTPQPSSVVDTVQEQTSEAVRLAGIRDQDRLADPRTNPAVRPLADDLRNRQHRSALKHGHERGLRRLRVEDRRAAHAEHALDALQEAREQASPAKSVLALNASRARYMHISLATSVVLAFGSALGLEKIADTHDAIPNNSGFIAEVGLTGLATIVVMARSDLTRNGGRLKLWQDVVMWTLMVAPLVASVAANVHARNVIGGVCAVGAAAFALFSYVVADAFAISAGKQANKVTGDDEADLHAIAAGEALFVNPRPRTWAEVQEFRLQPVEFAPPQVQVHAEQVHEPTAVQVQEEVRPPVRELDAGPANQPTRTSEPEPVEPVNQPDREPVGTKVREPKPEPRTMPKPQVRRTTNLTDRAAKKAAEVQQVLNLIQVRGHDAVTLGVVREVLGFTKTTAYNRLCEARELAKAEPANHEAVNQ